MRRAFLVSICAVAALIVGGCGSGGQTRGITDYSARVHIDPRGWLVEVPHGWRIVSFSEQKEGVSSSGVVISNVRLPRPSLEPGYMVQVNGNVLPARGVGLVIASDSDRRLPRRVARVPPLPRLETWLKGSALGGEPYLESVWFRIKGRYFLADAKIGAKATGADLAALGWISETVRAH